LTYNNKVIIPIILTIAAVLSVIAIVSYEYYNQPETVYNTPIATEIYDKSQNQAFAQKLVDEAIQHYSISGEFLSGDDLYHQLPNGETRYSFVIDFESDVILADPNQSEVGLKILDNIEPVESWNLVKEVLADRGWGWVHYPYENPDTGIVELKMSWLELYDGLIFGSGFDAHEDLYDDHHDTMGEDQLLPVETINDDSDFFISDENGDFMIVLDHCERQELGLSIEEPFLVFYNDTHYIDNIHCIWETHLMGNSQNEFDETFGSSDNRHPAFLDYDIPESCTEEMIKHLVNHSNMFELEGDYYTHNVPFADEFEDDGFVLCEEELLENRS